MLNSKDICRAAVETFGEQNQIEKLFEELAELQVAVCHYREGRGDIDDIAQEISDVSVMLEQLAKMYNCEKEVAAWRAYKLNRLRSTVESRKREMEDSEIENH